ncbi:hypothetical protein ABZ826_27145 [Streptomyces sp. NPDC047515]
MFFVDTVETAGLGNRSSLAGGQWVVPTAAEVSFTRVPVADDDTAATAT